MYYFQSLCVKYALTFDCFIEFIQLLAVGVPLYYTPMLLVGHSNHLKHCRKTWAASLCNTGHLDDSSESPCSLSESMWSSESSHDLETRSQIFESVSICTPGSLSSLVSYVVILSRITVNPCLSMLQPSFEVAITLLFFFIPLKSISNPMLKIVGLEFTALCDTCRRLVHMLIIDFM